MQWVFFSKICQILFQDLKPYNQEEVKYILQCGFLFGVLGMKCSEEKWEALDMQRILVLSVTGTCFCQTEILYHQKFMECILPYQGLNQQSPPPA